MNMNEMQPNRAESPKPHTGSGTSRTIVWRKHSDKSGFLAGVLFCVVLGLGYYAWNLWSHNQQLIGALKQSKKEIDKLRVAGRKKGDQVNTLREALGVSERKAFDLDSKLAAIESRFEELREERRSIASRLAEFRRVSKQFQRMINSGKLEVIFRRGRMIVQLPEKVLFPSGSADLTKDGADALKQVAKILRKVADKRFIVAGHTDNVPISNDDFASNWELSVARAVNVTRSLISTGLGARRLSAAGYAQFDPIATNSTSAGRQKNRRIEIILEPRLKKPPETKKATKKATKKPKTKTVKKKK
jgi:chemotaxis protein MotB